mgnify:CR=1 FL=1
MEKEIVNILETNVLLINKRKDKIGKINLKDKLKTFYFIILISISFKCVFLFKFAFFFIAIFIVSTSHK